MLSLLSFKKALYLILIIRLFKSLSNIALIARNTIILNRNAINSLIRVVKTMIILTTITIEEMTAIMTIITMIIMMIINSKTKRIAIEEMINLITKNVVAKIETLSNLLTIKGKS